jgi:glycosyltransferase involved in cell wall biosynthesis
MENSKLYLSIVVPVFNEQDAIAELHAKILHQCRQLKQPFEIIFINDGSSDKTLEVMKSLVPLTIINLRKNFGQTAALDAGFKKASGHYIVALDGDGQNDPADIPNLIKKLEADNLDCVSGWRNKRQDTFSKKISSRFAAGIRKILINDGIHDSGCTLKIYKKECFDNVDLVGEMHRFIPAILKINGFRIGEIPVQHHLRTTGVTKYNFKRGIKGILDMFAVWFWKKYVNRPLHLFGTLGLFLITISIIGGFWLVFIKLFRGQSLSDTALTILVPISFLMGAQFFIFGLIADLISKNHHAIKGERAYVIKEVIEQPEKDVSITPNSL